VAPADTDTTSTAVQNARIQTTPLPYRYVHSSLVNPYDLHRISSNQIYVRGSAVASADAQSEPVYIPYQNIYRRAQPSPYFGYEGKK